MDSKKSNKIRDIVRLQQILKKWRKLANSSKSTTICSNNNNNNRSGSKSIKFLKRTLSISDKTICEASSISVPKGYLAVCVGEEQKRFVIPMEYLGHHAFHILLREAEEEFGFEQAGILRIPCEVSLFESILKMVEEKRDPFCFKKYRLNKEECGSSDAQISLYHHPESPMCR
ncbi:protein SMALL AUXIN UP-REGULATED RNA 9 [Ziziphus jujuba]|uniref:Protein SMALL AUXIN UP-REGULATED RNA 9 n=2 Tax=Ziziphus jujuba TaxID=326968 RepID=A0ABM4AAC9_ZIZJJ|nr:auxin-responsive protein SAUR72 [Ziziphus jujuba var. spinosa]XP_060673687.1 protein SMALL AUXIN UP-REGULATED RNA 9 [Ziziphus jujuba]KAH7524239.1 hypothetical protein FEM48_Zijuj06G0098100 [Ziziphus jujuba var. spinosa]